MLGPQASARTMSTPIFQRQGRIITAAPNSA